MCVTFFKIVMVSYAFAFFPVPPHGQEDLGNLQSIFERAHLKTSGVFLNTQCKSQQYFSAVCIC
jgi:hypothetical protein